MFEPTTVPCEFVDCNRPISMDYNVDLYMSGTE